MTGVRTSPATLPAGLVIDATGRRSPIDDWLKQIGARASATWQAECGIAYFSRHYRVRPGARLPGLLVTRIVVALDEFLAGSGEATTVPSSWWWRRWPPTAGSVRGGEPAMCSPPCCGPSPPTAAWLDVMDPITDVFPMAGLHNTLRRLVTEGTLVATGLHAIGDSVCTTNPTLGRGLALALTNAADLADTVSKHPGDPAAQALAMDRLVGEHVLPFYQDQAAVDAARLAIMRGTPSTAHRSPSCPKPPAGSVTPQLRAAALLRPGRLPRFLEDQRHGLPARGRSTPSPGVVARHAEDPQAALRHRSAGHSAHPRAAQHRPCQVEGLPQARSSGRRLTAAWEWRNLPNHRFKADWSLLGGEQNVHICAPMVRSDGIYEIAPNGGDARLI